MRRLAMIAGAALLVGCHDVFGPPDRALRVSTDLSSYVQGGAVRVRLENRSGKSVAMSGCPNAPATIVDQKISGKWVDVGAFNATCLDNFSEEHVTLAPGDDMEFVITALDAGVYRLRVFQGSRILGISNEFESK